MASDGCGTATEDELRRRKYGRRGEGEGGEEYLGYGGNG